MRTTSTLSWWQEPPRVELADIMDELDPGWSSWRGDDRSPSA